MKIKNFCNFNEFFENIKEGYIIKVNETYMFPKYRFICLEKNKSNFGISMKGFVFDKNLISSFKRNIIWSYADNQSLFRFEIIC